MALYFETLYKLADNANLTTGKTNDTNEHIDMRLDNLEQHVANVTNPHDVDDGDVGCSLVTHEHTFTEHFTIATSSTPETGQAGPAPMLLEARTVLAVVATLEVAWGKVTVDIEKSGDNGATYASILTRRIQIDLLDLTSVTSVLPAIIGTTALAANDRIRAIVIDNGVISPPGGPATNNAQNLTVGVLLSSVVSED